MLIGHSSSSGASIQSRISPNSERGRGIRPVVAFELEFYLFDAQLEEGMPKYPRDRLSDDRDDQPN
ncbi:hypothetical protein, partial [Burkholderia sp. Ac-20349]|uniref:hypothetical protein n=1 Tax=Burkholderia sp. Ac-20349 TaxID=2703893 RepID=UPI0024026727